MFIKYFTNQPLSQSVNSNINTFKVFQVEKQINPTSEKILNAPFKIKTIDKRLIWLNNKLDSAIFT